MTLLQNLKSIYLLRLWPVLELLFGSMLLVFWLMLMIVCHLFSVVIWLLALMLHKGLVLVLTLGESGVLIPELEAVKSSTQELYLSSKSLRQQLSVAHKTVFVGVLLQCISLFGTKKLKTLLYSKTTKVRKIIEYVNLTTVFNYLKSSMRDLFKMAK